MSRETGIEWTDSTFNCWMGCTNISPGCERCHAEAWSKRAGLVQWGNHPRRRTSAAYWKQPVQWNVQATQFQAQHGRRQRVFCASLADWLDNQVDPGWRRDLLNLIDCTPQLDWLLLTKRPENARKLVPADRGARRDQKGGRHPRRWRPWHGHPQGLFLNSASGTKNGTKR